MRERNGEYERGEDAAKAVAEYQARGGSGTAYITPSLYGWRAKVHGRRNGLRGYVAPNGVLVPVGNVR